MPIYAFECQACQHTLEIKSSICKPVPNKKKCPVCNKLKLRQILFPVHVYNKPLDSEGTVGLLAQRNTERLSEGHKIELSEKHRTGPKRPERVGKNFWEK